MVVLLPILTGIICILSFFLLLRDMENWKDTVENDQAKETVNAGIPKAVIVYSLISIILTVVIAIFFPKLYPENSVWVNVKRMTLLALLWPLAYIDFKTYRIPNLFVIFGLICRAIIFVFELLLGNEVVWINLLSEVVAAVALLVASLLCVLVIKNGIGFGDMKLFIVMGLMLGLEGIWGAIFVALLVSFFIAAFLLISKKKTRKDAIPFGPAIVIGTYLSVFLSRM